MDSFGSQSLMERIERRRVTHPAVVVPLVFLTGIVAGTILLMLPLARAGGLSGVQSADFVTALFTSTSALCVTGLEVVDTPTYWSPFGQVIILLLFQAGGVGIMTSATLFGVLVSRTLPLRGRLLASADMRSLELGDIRQVLWIVVIGTFATELLLTLWLTVRFLFWGMGLGAALWNGLFLACSAFTNTGLSTLPEGLIPHDSDFLLLAPLMIGVVLGGVGFPVLHELRLSWRRPSRWSIHTKLTLWGTLGLTLVGGLFILFFEWNNQKTIGGAAPGLRTFEAMFYSVMTRSGGFAIFDPTDMRPDSILLSTLLMMIGGGSASTAGGIRITTFLLLGFVVWSEIRRNPDTIAFHRRIPVEIIRRTVVIVLMALLTLFVGVLSLSALTDAPFDHIVFEVTSAVATAGFSTGVSSAASPAGQLVLTLMMYLGRVGSDTLAATFALPQRNTPVRFPEERPIVG